MRVSLIGRSSFSGLWEDALNAMDNKAKAFLAQREIPLDILCPLDKNCGYGLEKRHYGEDTA